MEWCMVLVVYVGPLTKHNHHYGIPTSEWNQAFQYGIQHVPPPSPVQGSAGQAWNAKQRSGASEDPVGMPICSLPEPRAPSGI